MIWFAFSFLRGNLQRHFFVGEIDLLDAGFLAHFRAVLRGMIEEELVEIGARDLVGTVHLRAKAVFEIELHPIAAAGAEHFAAELFHEAGPREFLVQTEPGESLHAEREKRLADMETRELFALEDDDAAPRAREQGGRSAARRPAADYRHVIGFAAHWVTKVAKIGGCKRLDEVIVHPSTMQMTAQSWGDSEVMRAERTIHWDDRQTELRLER